VSTSEREYLLAFEAALEDGCTLQVADARARRAVGVLEALSASPWELGSRDDFEITVDDSDFVPEFQESEVSDVIHQLTARPSTDVSGWTMEEVSCSRS
jgi:hypothetical protein